MKKRAHFEKRIYVKKIGDHFKIRVHYGKRVFFGKRVYFEKRVYFGKSKNYLKKKVYFGKRSHSVKKVHFEKIGDHFKKASHKKVTIFRNLQLFGLLNDSFVSCLRHYYASSAGIHEEKKERTEETVVQLQGNHIKSIRKFFKEKYGIEGEYIKIE